MARSPSPLLVRCEHAIEALDALLPQALSIARRIGARYEIPNRDAPVVGATPLGALSFWERGEREIHRD
jgi:hypothetical protein